MGIKIKNLQTGEFEKFNIPALKGEKGEPGEIEPSEKVDYIGKQHSKLRDTMNANVDYIIKTAVGEFNYLDYEGQHITATNSIEGHAKSAILTGNTLVNLVGEKREYTNGNLYGWEFMLPYNLTSGKTYLAVFNATGTINDKNARVYLMDNAFNSNAGNTPYPVDFKIGHNRLKCIASNDIHRVLRIRTGGQTKNDLKVSDVMFFEYQEGMENWDIPYFEGMQSVQMPVLTTMGKNLCNRVRGYHSNTGGTQNSWASFDMLCKPNTTYTAKIFSGSNNRFGFFSGVGVVGSTDSYKVTGGNFTPYTGGEKTFTITTGNNDNVMWVYLDNNSIVSLDDVVVQVEESPTATTYEPYKSNILHTPEEVVLRSLPSGVCDTLNVETGEYVQRIGEVVLDGSYIAHSNQSGYSSITSTAVLLNLKSSEPPQNRITKFICKDLPHYLAGDAIWAKGTPVDTGISGVSGAWDFCIRLPYTVTGGTSADSNDVIKQKFKEYLNANPVTVQYELKTPIIKTVDLSDNHVYSYKGTTHYSCSSEEGSLVPTLSVKVPTDTQLTIQEQKAATQTLLIKNMDLQQSIKEVQAMNLAFNTALYNSFNSIREEVEDIKKHVSTNENLEGSF